MVANNNFKAMMDIKNISIDNILTDDDIEKWDKLDNNKSKIQIGSESGSKSQSGDSSGGSSELTSEDESPNKSPAGQSPENLSPENYSPQTVSPEYKTQEISAVLNGKVLKDQKYLNRYRIEDYELNLQQEEYVDSSDSSDEKSLASDNSHPILGSEESFIDKETQVSDLSLKYGSVITINLKPKEEDNWRSLTTVFYASSVCKSRQMNPDQFDDYSRFRIVPAFQFTSQRKLKKTVDGKTYANQISAEYDNFITEGWQNIEDYDRKLNGCVRYDEEFQLYHESSKRFLCMAPGDTVKFIEEFEGTFVDGDVYSLGFSEVSNEYTHFKFEASSHYQQNESQQVVRLYHDMYLASGFVAQLYLYHKRSNCIFSKALKTALKICVLKNELGNSENEALQKISGVMLTSGLNNACLTCRNEENNREWLKEDSLLLRKPSMNSEIDVALLWHLMYDPVTKCFRLQNMRYETYLCLSEVDGKQKLDLTSKPDESTNFVLKHFSDRVISPRQIDNGTRFKMQYYDGDSDKQNDLYVKLPAKYFMETPNYIEENNRKSNFKMSIIDDLDKFFTFKFNRLSEEQRSELLMLKDLKICLKFIKKKANDDVTSLIIHTHKQEVAKIFSILYHYVKNQLETQTCYDYPIDCIIPYRQNLVAQLGILEMSFSLAKLLLNEKSEGQKYEKTSLGFPFLPNCSYLEDVIFKAIHVMIHDNQDSIKKIS